MILSRFLFTLATFGDALSPPTATLTLGDLTQAYDGSPKAASVIAVPTDLTVDLTCIDRLSALTDNPHDCTRLLISRNRQ